MYKSFSSASDDARQQEYFDSVIIPFVAKKLIERDNPDPKGVSKLYLSGIWHEVISKKEAQERFGKATVRSLEKGTELNHAKTSQVLRYFADKHPNTHIG